jgi:hypothetical protein
MAAESGLSPLSPTLGLSEKTLRSPKAKRFFHPFKKNKGSGKENKDQPGQFDSEVQHGGMDTTEAPHNRLPNSVAPYAHLLQPQYVLPKENVHTTTVPSQQPRNQLSSNDLAQDQSSQNPPHHHSQAHIRPTQHQTPARALTLPQTLPDNLPLRQATFRALQPSEASTGTTPRVITRKSPIKHDSSNGVDEACIINNGRGSPRALPDPASGHNTNPLTLSQKPESYQVNVILGGHSQRSAAESDEFAGLPGAGLPPETSTFSRVRMIDSQGENITAPTSGGNEVDRGEPGDGPPTLPPREDNSEDIVDTDNNSQEPSVYYDRTLNLLNKKLLIAEAAKVAAEAEKTAAEAVKNLAVEEKDNAEYSYNKKVQALEEDLRKAKEEGRQAAEQELNLRIQEAENRTRRAEDIADRQRLKVEQAEESVNILVKAHDKKIEGRDQDLAVVRSSLLDCETRLSAAEQALVQAQKDCTFWRTNADGLNQRMHKLLQDSGQQMDSSAIKESYRKLRGKIELFSTDFFQGPLSRPSSTPPALTRLTADYYDYIKDPNARPKLIQGYIWRLLFDRVFAPDALLWADSKQWDLYNLFTFLRPSNANGTSLFPYFIASSG